MAQNQVFVHWHIEDQRLLLKGPADTKLAGSLITGRFIPFATESHDPGILAHHPAN